MNLIKGKDESSAGKQLIQRLLDWQNGEEVTSHLARSANAGRAFFITDP